LIDQWRKKFRFVSLANPGKENDRARDKSDNAQDYLVHFEYFGNDHEHDYDDQNTRAYLEPSIYWHFFHSFYRGDGKWQHGMISTMILAGDEKF